MEFLKTHPFQRLPLIEWWERYQWELINGNPKVLSKFTCLEQVFLVPNRENLAETITQAYMYAFIYNIHESQLIKSQTKTRIKRQKLQYTLVHSVWEYWLFLVFKHIQCSKKVKGQSDNFTWTICWGLQNDVTTKNNYEVIVIYNLEHNYNKIFQNSLRSMSIEMWQTTASWFITSKKCWDTCQIHIEKSFLN